MIHVWLPSRMLLKKVKKSLESEAENTLLFIAEFAEWTSSTHEIKPAGPRTKLLSAGSAVYQTLEGIEVPW